MHSWSTKTCLPTKADANALGFVFARSCKRIGYEGVLWNDVNRKDHDRWARIDGQWRAMGKSKGQS